MSTEREEKIKTGKMIVVFVGDKPSCAWTYIDRKETLTDIVGKETEIDTSYGYLFGYWDGDDPKVAKQFVRHTSNSRKLIPFDKFIAHVSPDVENTKVYDSYGDFMVELI